jgi:ABC-type Mn2+/Zn2+ transport system ATPase subunit
VAVLEVRSLLIGYAGTAILPPVSFRLEPGQVTSIVGHNGSGKSTLLRTLLGLHPRIGGEIARAPSAGIGYVPQRESMDPIYPVRVLELVETGRYAHRRLGQWLRAEDRERIRAAMEATGIWPLRDRLFRTLSGGEQQRALLARALCVEPAILVLDEPTASMDERGAEEAMRLTLELAKGRGAAILMVNHFIDLVRRVSDQVIRLDRDRQRVDVGPPSKVLREAAE